MAAETWISVDIETSGPTPSTGSLLSIGACLVADVEVGIELLVRPDPALPWTAEAEAIHGLDRATLERDGLSPADAVGRLDAWLGEVVPAGSRPVFVALNAPFDWMFVADACWRHLGRNPFGPSALDIKAMYLGRHLAEVGEWSGTGRQRMLERYPVSLPHTHTALADAQEQGLLCRRILEAARREAQQASGDDPGSDDPRGISRRAAPGSRGARPRAGRPSGHGWTAGLTAPIQSALGGAGGSRNPARTGSRTGPGANLSRPAHRPLPPRGRMTVALSRRERIALALHRRSDRLMSRFAVWLMRRTRGRITRLYHVDAFVLTTTGRRTGARRSVVLQFFPDGDAFVVVAANAGSDQPPAWSLNLGAIPEAEVEVGGRRIVVRAEVLEAEEATRRWPRILERAPGYERYLRATSRPLPLIRLEPLR